MTTMTKILVIHNNTLMPEFSTAAMSVANNLDLNLNAKEKLSIIQILDTDNHLKDFNWTLSIQEHAHYEHWLINLSKTDVNYKLQVNLEGKAAALKLRCIILGQGKVNLQHQIKVEHQADETKTDILMHGIADDQSRIGFTGLMKVNEKIKNVEAHELLKNLLLSNTAQIEAKPELEIYSNEVACTHGASVGDLDDEALFYLQSRGFNHQEAKNILLKAFTINLLTTLENAKLEAHLEQIILREIKA